MNSYFWRLLIFFLLLYPAVHAQRLKKADRAIMANVQAHVAFLSANGLNGPQKASGGNKSAEEYISKQFARSGLKPNGDSSGWFQQFEVYEGKTVLPASFLTINGKKLGLLTEYFPMAFSANKKTEAAVAIALAEKGVPWFKDLKELLESREDSAIVDTMALIREKAIMAANKGASALVMYSSGEADLAYDAQDRSDAVTIPVVYISRKAFKQYCSDESAILDIAMNIELVENRHMGTNIIGFADNNADSTLIATAHLENETDVAALMELARLVRNNKQSRKKNYLFIAYSGERAGETGSQYFRQHPLVNLQKVKRTVNLDTVAVGNENPKELHLVKRSLEIITSN